MATKDKRKHKDKGKKHHRRAPEVHAKFTGEGLVARFSPIRGVTPRNALDRRIWLPAMLGTFRVDESALHTEYDTLSAGQFSQPAMGPMSARQLRKLNVDTLTVDFDAPWLVATGQDPYELRVRLSEILRSKRAVHLLIFFNPNPDRHSEFDGSVTFRDLSREVRPGERESRYLTISLSEWRDSSARRRTSTGSVGKHVPATHKLRATDTLNSLAFEYYGDYVWWRLIRDANGIPKRFGQKTKIVTLGGQFKVGHKIKIPDPLISSHPQRPSHHPGH